jgi:hypothetical protein
MAAGLPTTKLGPARQGPHRAEDGTVWLWYILQRLRPDTAEMLPPLGHDVGSLALNGHNLDCIT